MESNTEMIQLTGQQCNEHIQMREDLRGLLQKMQQQEQKLLTQLGVQNYQGIRDSTARGIMEEAHKKYQQAGQWDALLTRHLEKGYRSNINH